MWSVRQAILGAAQMSPSCSLRARLGPIGMVRNGGRVHLLTVRPLDPQYITFFPIELPRSGKGFVEALMGRARFVFRDRTCVDHFPFGQNSLRCFVGLRMARKCPGGNGCGWFPRPGYSESNMLQCHFAEIGSSPHDGYPQDRP